MPSSSQCDTHQEKSLLQDLKVTFMRFFYNNMHQEANHVLKLYGEILERPGKMLTNHFYQDRDDWEQWKQYILKEKLIDSLWSATRSLHTSAETLVQHRRGEESKILFRCAEQAEQLARDNEET